MGPHGLELRDLQLQYLPWKMEPWVTDPKDLTLGFCFYTIQGPIHKKAKTLQNI